ncbi:MAG: aminomethyl-transferring glycine dehydrogenase subunit GcvPA [Fimbriimonadaceae bacterium]|nr:aminomethyl-transferring glycine dehydrogenase subunit GcvPA [Fimbriimonadaceae bacterium]
MSRPYIPHTEEDVKEMLATIGAGSIEELFREVPDDLKLKGQLDVPASLDEHRLLGHLFELSRKNKNLLTDLVCFLGAGIYDRYIPATVGALISRGEFLTAYTPYQPELSQGYLQTIYEFQTMVADLYGMEIANASLYDGATGTAEAAILCHGVNGRQKIAVSDAVHPHYRQVLETYCWSIGLDVVVINHEDGATTDYSKLDQDTACVIVQYPNFFGTIEDLAQAREAATQAGAMFVVVADPIACALLKPPGEYGADIVVGEGQPMGVAMGFGGPVVGLFACKTELVRRIPGRIVGKTLDHDGNPGYVMTLRTREQDIRREKATSNICTNQALMALAATIYMSALGKNGMQTVAESTVRNTQYAMSKLSEAGARVKYSGKVFGEFVLELPKSAETVQRAMMEKGVLAGLPLGKFYQGMENCLLVAVTETRTKAQIDDFATKLSFELA